MYGTSKVSSEIPQTRCKFPEREAKFASFAQKMTKSVRED